MGCKEERRKRRGSYSPLQGHTLSNLKLATRPSSLFWGGVVVLGFELGALKLLGKCSTS
jgi:hypothetical protein